MDSDVKGLGQGKHQLTEERVAHLADAVAELHAGGRSRKSSLSSALTDVSQMEVDDQPRPHVQSGAESEDSDSGEDESESENAEDDPMNGVTMESSDDKSMQGGSTVAAQVAGVGLRRSARTKQTPEVITAVKPLPLPHMVVARKPVVRKDAIHLLVSVCNNPFVHKLTLFRMT